VETECAVDEASSVQLTQRRVESYVRRLLESRSVHLSYSQSDLDR